MKWTQEIWRLKKEVEAAETKAKEQASLTARYKGYYEFDEQVLGQLCAQLGIRDGERKDAVQDYVRRMLTDNAMLHAQVKELNNTIHHLKDVAKFMFAVKEDDAELG